MEKLIVILTPENTKQWLSNKTEIQVEVPLDAKDFSVIDCKDDNNTRIYFYTKEGGTKYLPTYTVI